MSKLVYKTRQDRKRTLRTDCNTPNRTALRTGGFLFGLWIVRDGFQEMGQLYCQVPTYKQGQSLKKGEGNKRLDNTLSPVSEVVTVIYECLSRAGKPGRVFVSMLNRIKSVKD